MKVLIDVSTAPEHVVSWVASQLEECHRKNCELQVAEVAEVAEVPEVTEVTEVPEVTEVTEVTEVPEVTEVTEVPSLDVVLVAAKKYLQANGSSGLKEVLDSLGVKAVSKCPEDKMADLLAAIATGE